MKHTLGKSRVTGGSEVYCARFYRCMKEGRPEARRQHREALPGEGAGGVSVSCWVTAQTET